MGSKCEAEAVQVGRRWMAATSLFDGRNARRRLQVIGQKGGYGEDT